MADFTYNGNVDITALPGSAVTMDWKYNTAGVGIALSPGAEYKILRYNTDISITLSPLSSISGGRRYTGNLSVTLLPSSVKKTHFTYPASIPGAGLALTLTSPSVVKTAGYKPYQLKASCKIAGVDYSNSLHGTVSVNKSTSAATTFQFQINAQGVIPSDFIDQEVVIGFQAADDTGSIVDVQNLVIGRVREVDMDVDTGILQLNGYDYGGVHNDVGEFYSGNVTTILTGTVGITSAGVIDTGFSPIWNVTYSGPEDVEDGRDYYVDSLNGKIYIPLISNLLNSSSSLSFQYAEYFDDFNKLAQAIADVKGWNISLDGVVVSDYTDKKYQPIITFSNESIIDILRKLFEIAGGRLDTALYPTLRVYSEVVNDAGATKHTFTESDIFEDTLQIRCMLDNLVTEQTVKSVQNTYSNVNVGSFTEAGSDSGTELQHWLWWSRFDSTTQAAIYEQAVAMANTSEPEIVREITIDNSNVNGVNFTASGGGVEYLAVLVGVYAGYPTVYKYKTSVAGNWSYTTDYLNDQIIFQCKRSIEIIEVQQGGGYGVYVVAYPQVDWDITINTQEIDYGEGAATAQVEVTGVQTIQKITATLVGDVYEHSFLETSAQATDLCKAILLEHGVIFEASCVLPLHKAANLSLGDKTTINSKSRKVEGVLKEISYSLDIDNGSGEASILVKGTGTGV